MFLSVTLLDCLHDRFDMFLMQLRLFHAPHIKCIWCRSLFGSWQPQLRIVTFVFFFFLEKNETHKLLHFLYGAVVQHFCDSGGTLDRVSPSKVTCRLFVQYDELSM